MSGIFISYRREDTTAYARLLSESLAAHFGQDQIFRDVDTLTPGADFPESIAQAVGKCNVLLVLIGKQWLAAKRQGKRRLEDPGDYVRLEITAALERNTLVVPVLMEDTRMPSRQELPEALGELADRNAHRLTDDGWNDGVRRLIAALEKVVPPARATPSAPSSTSSATAAPAPGWQSPRPWEAAPAAGPAPAEPSSSLPWGAPPSPAPAGQAPPPSGTRSDGKRTAIIAGVAVAAIAIIVAIVMATSGGGGGTSRLPIDPSDFLAETNVTISPSTGPSGTIVTVTGSGFLPNEGIEIIFHADVVTQTRADGEGRFSGVTFAVPQNAFDGQTDVTVLGRRSAKHGRAQFRVT